MTPGRGCVSVERVLGGPGHRVFRRVAAADDVEARRAEELRHVRVRLAHHALAEAASELDLAPGLVAEHVLDEEWHAAEGARAEALLVEIVDAIRIGLDDRVHARVGFLDRARGSLRHLLRGNLALRDQPGDAERVVARVLLEVHAFPSEGAWYQLLRGQTPKPRKPRGLTPKELASRRRELARDGGGEDRGERAREEAHADPVAAGKARGRGVGTHEEGGDAPVHRERGGHLD